MAAAAPMITLLSTSEAASEMARITHSARRAYPTSSLGAQRRVTPISMSLAARVEAGGAMLGRLGEAKDDDIYAVSDVCQYGRR